MSINVTVTGNPVKICKRMVAADPTCCKKEFDKRRLMRLEQVRQQSKTIAEQVRKKVHREKCKQTSQLENEGRAQLKDWQTRKLLELHDQYHEALKDIGLGHKEAVVAADVDEDAERRRDALEEEARQRGEQAERRAQAEQRERDRERRAAVERRKQAVNSVEKTRAMLVSKVYDGGDAGEENKRKKLSTYTERNVEVLSSTNDDGSVDTGCNCSSADPEEYRGIGTKRVLNGQRNGTDEKQTSTTDILPELITSDKSAQTTCIQQNREKPTKTQQVSQETRISDRIKRRTILDNTPPDYSISRGISDNNFETITNHPHQPCHCNSQKIPPTNTQHQSSATIHHQQTIAATDKTNPVDVIPTKPKVTIRSVKPSAPLTNAKPVRFYDHSNRFSRNYIPTDNFVERIDDASLIVSPDPVSEAEFQERMQQRDKDAKDRGRKALEKEKIHREHRELLNKLPLLQKQERICGINNDKPKYHMTEERRLETVERKKQNQMDTVYEKLFPKPRKPAVVTLRSKSYEKKDDDNNVIRLRMNEVVPTVNLAEWDVQSKESPKLFTSEEVKEIIDQLNKQQEQGQNLTRSDRSDQLKELLDSLKAKKELLLKEIGMLPVNCKDDDKENEATMMRSQKHQEKSKRRRHKDGSNSSSSSDVNLENNNDRKSASSRNTISTKSTTAKASPRKKARLKSDRRKVLILQNTSTQTTPKVSLSNDEVPVQESHVDKATSPLEVAPTATKRQDNVCQKSHVPCNCYCRNEQQPIEIVIKTVGGDKPDISVPHTTTTTDNNNVNVVVEETPKTSAVAAEHIFTVPHPKPKQSKSKNRLAIKQSSKQGTTRVNDQRSTSWREHFSRNSNDCSTTTTTTTSYLSTPGENTVSRNSIRKTPKLMCDIEKVLARTRNSIDDLTVSVISEVSTPSQSIIETESNKNPLDNLLKYVNLTLGEGNTTNISDGKLDLKTSTPYSSTDCPCSSNKESDRKKSEKMIKDDAHMLAQYSNIAESCNKKISDLNAMIEKVREEKLKMLQSPADSLDNDDLSTAYLDLPSSSTKQTHKESSSSSSSSTTTSSGQEELNKLLLDIDCSSYVQLPQQKFSEEKDRIRDKSSHSDSNNCDDNELLSRFKRLLEVPSSNTSHNNKDQENETVDFIPLLDIPKLPKLTVPAVTITDTINSSTKKRPPTSKGLTVARRRNGNISLTPHELSTIVEADSQQSVKLDLSQKSTNRSAGKGFWVESKSSIKKEVPPPKTSPTIIITDDDNDSPKSNNSLPDILTEALDGAGGKNSSVKEQSIIDLSSHVLAKSSSTSTSTEDKSGTEAMEAMLYSIGMEWAIPTLRKTREARALSGSSSGSSDGSGATAATAAAAAKNLSKVSGSVKISSSTFKSDLSPGGFLSDSQEISGIDVQNRTSTPVDFEQSASRKKSSKNRFACFTEESDISSINNSKTPSDEKETKYYSLTDLTKSKLC